METESILRQAVAAVEAAGVPDDLRAEAFRSAIALLSGAGAASASPLTNPGRAPRKAGSPSKTKPVAQPASPAEELSTADFLSKFEKESGIGRDLLERVFYLKSGIPQINLTQRQLGSSKAEQSKVVCFALTAAYHFGLDVEEPLVSAIQAECRRIKCFDQANFANQARNAQGVTMVGPARGRQFKLRQADVPKLKPLLERLTGMATSEEG